MMKLCCVVNCIICSNDGNGANCQEHYFAYMNVQLGDEVCMCACFLWLPYVIGQTIIFLPCSFFLLLLSSFILSSPNLSGRRLDVNHTSTHGVALVRI